MPDNENILKIAQDSLIVFDQFGIQLDFIEEQIDSAIEEISTTIHSKFTEANIFPDDEILEEWLQGGYSCRVLEPGKNWQTGQLRFRVVTEFIPDVFEEEETPTQESEQSNDSSLDDIRNSIAPS
jgi:KGK domain